MNQPSRELPPLTGYRLLVYAVALLLILSLLRYLTAGKAPTAVPYSAFKQSLREGGIASVTMRGEVIEGV